MIFLEKFLSDRLLYFVAKLADVISGPPLAFIQCKFETLVLDEAFGAAVLQKEISAFKEDEKEI